MKLGIVGNGIVGGATLSAFAPLETLVYDVVPERSKNDLNEVLKADLIFVCLPTPQVERRYEADTSYIDTFFAKALEAPVNAASFVLRSTVPIGYTKSLAKKFSLSNLAYWPEFLTVRSAAFDARYPTRNLVGNVATKEGELNPAAVALWDLVTSRWPTVDLYVDTSDNVEAAKLFQNAFSAVKISFFNEINLLSEALGLNWERVLAMLLAGGWINPKHTEVPGPDGLYGFGGACLPKDLASLVHQLIVARCDADISISVLRRNRKDRSRARREPNKD